jgi:hypothetical protein
MLRRQRCCVIGHVGIVGLSTRTPEITIVTFNLGVVGT